MWARVGVILAADLTAAEKADEYFLDIPDGGSELGTDHGDVRPRGIAGSGGGNNPLDSKRIAVSLPATAGGRRLKLHALETLESWWTAWTMRLRAVERFREAAATPAATSLTADLLASIGGAREGTAWAVRCLIKFMERADDPKLGGATVLRYVRDTFSKDLGKTSLQAGEAELYFLRALAKESDAPTYEGADGGG